MVKNLTKGSKIEEMENILPYGLSLNPTPAAIWIIPLALIFTFYTFKQKDFSSSLFWRGFKYIVLVWNTLIVVTNLFYFTVLPIPEKIFNGIWLVLLAIGLFPLLLKKTPKFF